MKEKILPLTKGNITEAEEAYKLWSNIEEKIEDRINYVIRTLAKIFGGKIEWWDWNNGGGEVDGHLDMDMFKNDSIQLDGCKKGGKDWVSVIKEGEWEFEYLEFPTRFLWEDFEEELENGIKEYEKQGKIRLAKEKKEKSKKDKQYLIESAKSKLTKEELKALRI